MSAEDIENHIRACGMNVKKYKRIERVIKNILDPKRYGNPTKDMLISVFARKCYGNFSRTDGKRQAKKFLEVLYDDLDYLVQEGPASALERASLKESKGGKKVMRIVRLNKPIDGFTKKLDSYLVGETIGKGATSVVKRGRREGEDKVEVAIKILTVDDKTFKINELMKEIEVLRELEHMNVIRMFDCFENVEYPGYTDTPTVVMVLELATKGELFDFFMHAGKFEPPLARWFFKQMIAGLEYCHNKKIAHRDLKPENLLMGEGFKVKLVDFGFARFFRDRETGKAVAMKTALGTPGYAAPEILNRQKYDYTVDIFSLGVILFICIAGFPPFQEAKASDWWFEKIINKRFELFWKAHERCMKFDDDAKDLLLGMLAARPADRYRWDTLRHHPWTTGETFTQDEASQALTKMKRIVDSQTRKKARNKPRRVQREITGLEELEVEAPLLGTFLPVHHLFTSVRGQLALEEVQHFIMREMCGEIRFVKTDIWVGHVPEEGIPTWEDSEEKTDSLKTVESSSADTPEANDLEVFGKDEALGFFWHDLEFTVDINQGEKKQDDGRDDEKSSGNDGLPKTNCVRVQGRVVVRRHPTMKSETGAPLNVVYLTRISRVMPYQWHQITRTITQGVAHIIEGPKTGYFEDSKKNSGLASSAVSALFCCSSGAAKKLVE